MQQDQINQLLAAAQKKLMAGDFDAATQAVAQILDHDANNKDGLYIQAVLYRYQQRLDLAEQSLQHLLSLAPSFGRALQELAYVYLAQNDTEEALHALMQATQSNPALIGAWKKLYELYGQMGNGPKAQEVEQQLSRIQSLPKELFAVTNFIHEDKLLKAEKICRAFLKENPTHVEGMRLLADIASRFGVLDEAEFLLSQAAAFAPDVVQVKFDLIQVLRKAQKFNRALDIAQELTAQSPDNPVFLSHFAIQAMQAGQYEKALDGFNQVLDKLPTDAATHTSKGHALKTLGQQSEAIESYQTALSAMPAYGDAWYGLANLKTYQFSADQLAVMEDILLSNAASVQHKIQIHFALGKGYEDQQDYKKSFAHYLAGNQLRHTDSRYNADQMDAEFQAQKEVCTANLFARDDGCPAPDPIFIVGLPRAGSTLIEQILASHSMVDGTMELPNILTIAQELRGRKKITAEDGYPHCLPSLSAEKCAELGQRYITETQQHRMGAPYFTDKMPNNFRHIGLIKRILPNAKIIDARRDPMACCFSGFKQLFAEGQEFTYSLESLGRYYRGYVDLMDHYDQVMPGAIHRVQYEDMIADSAAEIRQLLEYCGLPFEQACLDFHKTKRAVKTASSEQVREKINTKGLVAWAPFEEDLTPLKAALGDLVKD